MAIGGLNGFVSTEVQNSTSVLRLKFSAKNPAHRHYAARYALFMRKTLATLFILTSAYSYACTCTLADIHRSYTYSSAIFYGKYLGTDTVKGFNDIFGRPFIVDNFEITKFYKGVDSSTFNYYKGKHNTYIISLINNCNDACGICFEKDQMYLVYSYLDFFGGHLTTDGCTRTRKILNGNFYLVFRLTLT